MILLYSFIICYWTFVRSSVLDLKIFYCKAKTCIENDIFTVCNWLIHRRKRKKKKLIFIHFPAFRQIFVFFFFLGLFIHFLLTLSSTVRKTYCVGNTGRHGSIKDWFIFRLLMTWNCPSLRRTYILCRWKIDQ